MDQISSNAHLKPVSVYMQNMANDRIYCIEQAKTQQEVIRKTFETDGKGTPPFELVEMIGKGSYGRVYKARYHEPPHNEHEYVAIKVINADAQDYRTHAEERDNSFKEFQNELHILQVLSETKAKNINKVFDAYVLHSQLVWVTEYCPGGSVRTIMNAQPGARLVEKYVIPIAREIAIGLKCVHDVGIIHRDIKAANVLISEDGRVQLCDFGTSSLLMHETDKRSTILGTPHWMPLEMHEASANKRAAYRTEVDVWAYGCTVWEILTGTPPNAAKGPIRQLEVSLRRGAPRLTGDQYSSEVKKFLEFILQSDPSQRPSMQQVLDHPYLKDTEDSHPISLLSNLVADVIHYRQTGGQRQSLLIPGGALPAEISSDLDREFRESWNFSSTESFFNRHSRIMDLNALASLAEHDELTPSSSLKELTPIEKLNFDERVRRGEEAMGGMFDQSKPEYKYQAKRDFREVRETKRISDLPLRDATERSSVRDTQIDLGDFDPSHYAGESSSTFPVIQLADADTIRANRSNSRLFREATEGLTVKPGELEEYAVSSGDEMKRPPTQEWKFPSFMQPEDEANEPANIAKTNNRATLEWTFPKEALEEEPTGHRRPTLKHAATEPIVLSGDAMLSASPPGDFNFILEDDVADLPRPSTASSMSSDADYDPFKFDLDVNEVVPLEAAAAYKAYAEDDETTDPYLNYTDDALFNEYEVMEVPVPQQQEEDYTPLERPSIGDPDFPGQNVNIARALSAGKTGASNRIPDPTEGYSNIVVEFPVRISPSRSSLTGDASDKVVGGEINRLCGDWVEGLEAYIKAYEFLPEDEIVESAEGETEDDDD